MKFDQDFIEKVREANSLVEIIGEDTQIKQVGHRTMAYCPFPDHNEKTPSFSISEEKQVYYCFGCKKSGNLYSYLQTLRGMSFPEAVEYLAERAGIALPDKYQGQEAKSDQEKYKLGERINEFAAKYFQQALKKNGFEKGVDDYLKKRGLSRELIEEFEIGYCDDSWQGLTDSMHSKKVPLAVAAELGLVKAKKQGNGYFDLFRERLIFPIRSPRGKVVGFGGRILNPDHFPKYLNSPESFLFKKGKTFYGLHQTAKYIRSQDQVIVVEGYMDLLTLFGAGVKNVVATLGTALTPEHARLIKRYTKNLVVLFDGDEAGQRASHRSLPILLKEGLFPRALVLPEGQDPDDFLFTNGAKALEAKLQAAPELFQVVLEDLMGGYRGGADDKLRILDSLAPIFNQIQDSRLLSLYKNDVAERLGVEGEILDKSMRQSLSSSQNRTPSPQAIGVKDRQDFSAVDQKSSDYSDLQKVDLSRAPRTELYLLNLALKSQKYFDRVCDLSVEEKLTHSGVREIFKRASNAYRQDPARFDSLTAWLVAGVKPEGALTIQFENMLDELEDSEALRLIDEYAGRIEEAFLKAETKQMLAQSRGPMTPEQLEKLERFMNIQKQKRSLRRSKDSDL